MINLLIAIIKDTYSTYKKVETEVILLNKNKFK